METVSYESGFVVEIRKEDLEYLIKKFNDGLSKYENDDYLSKKHLLDYVDTQLDILIKKYYLDIEQKS